MAITVNVTGNLTLDQSDDVQTTLTTDTGNDTAVTYAGDVADPLVAAGLDTAFLTYLNGLGLSDAQKEYAALVGAASSGNNFITVSVTAGEEIDNLFFSDSSGALLNGDPILIDHDGNSGTAKVPLEALSDGADLFLWTDPNNTDICLITTDGTTFGAGRIVAVLYLDENDTDHLSAQVQMITFEALKHFSATNHDDNVNFTDALQVSASGTLSFNFEELKSGSSLWVAVGNSTAAMLVTGGNPLVDGEGKKTNDSDVIHTSQGGVDATIGVNNQLFDNLNETAVFTLVTGMDALSGSNDGAASDYVEDHTGPKADGIDYGGYINTTGASIFLSQSQGNDVKNFDINVFETGGDPDPGPQTVEDGDNYIGGLTGDTAVNVTSVTITDDDGNPVGTWVAGADPDGGGPLLASGAIVDDHASANGTTDVQVTITGNNIDVNGALGEYIVSWTTASGDTFNRFSLVAEGGQFDVGRVDIDNVVGDSEGVGDNLLVDDDGPVIGDSAGGSAIPNSTVQFVQGATSGAKALGDVPGTDGQGSLQITNFTSTVALTDVTLKGIINGAKTEVKYFEDLNGNSIIDSGETLYYTLSITQNANSGDSYTFVVNNAPDAPLLTFDFDNLPSGSNLFGSVADLEDPTGPGIFVFGKVPVLNDNTKYNNQSDVIHTSQGGIGATIGVNNQMCDPDEGAFFTFVESISQDFLAGVDGGLTSTEADFGRNLDYGALHNIDAAFMGISQIQAGSTASLNVTAYSLDSAFQEVALINNSGKAADKVNIVSAAVYNGSVDPDNLVEVTGAGGVDGGMNGDITITITNGIVSVSGLTPGQVVAWDTGGNTHNQVLIDATGGKFDIGFFGFNEEQLVPDHSLNFEVTLKDGDNDLAVDTFTVNVDAIPFAP